MMPVKIECECGQHYAFDVEPINGKMPSPVACPDCGADGTAAANEFISRQLAPDSLAAVPNPKMARLAIAQPEAIPESSRRGAVDLNKVEQQARAKIMWGDSKEQVAAFLTVQQGLSRDEAAELAERLFRERTAIVRSNGIKKIIVGLALMCVPVAAYFAFSAAGRFPIRRSIWCYVVGVVGAYMFVSGILAIVAPKSEGGAVAKE